MNRVDYKKSRELIRSGPIFPIVTPFTEVGDVDLVSLRKYVMFLVENGVKVLLGTVGTSRYNLLTREEMKAVNQTVVEAAGNRAVTIVAGPGPQSGSTRENIEFARHAQSVGADAILALYPERWYGDKAIIDFYHEVADSTTIGVMIHAMPLRDGYGGIKSVKYLTADVLKKVVVDYENIIGIKEESGEREVFEKILKELNSVIPIIGAGGAMRRFMKDHDLGSSTYLVGIGSFVPRLAVEFYEKVVHGDTRSAEEIATKFEDPYFDFAVSCGWHPALKESLGLMGLMQPHERAPMMRIPIAKRRPLAELMEKIGWLSA